METKKFKRNPDPTVGIMKKGGCDAQPWYNKEVIFSLRNGEVVTLPANAPEYITNIQEWVPEQAKSLSSVRAQKEKKTETFKEVSTGVKEEVASTPKKESDKTILKKPNRQEGEK